MKGSYKDSLIERIMECTRKTSPLIIMSLSALPTEDLEKAVKHLETERDNNYIRLLEIRRKMGLKLTKEQEKHLFAEKRSRLSSEELMTLEARKRLKNILRLQMGWLTDGEQRVLKLKYKRPLKNFEIEKLSELII